MELAEHVIEETFDKNSFSERTQNLTETSSSDSDVPASTVSSLPTPFLEGRHERILEQSGRIVNESIDYVPEYYGSTSHKPSKANLNLSSFETSNKLIPFFSISNNLHEAQFKNKLQNIQNAESCYINSHNSESRREMVWEYELLCSELDADLEDLYPSVFAKSPILSRWNEIPRKSEFNVLKNSTYVFPFHTLNYENIPYSSVLGLQKDNSLCNSTNIGIIDILLTLQKTLSNDSEIMYNRKSEEKKPISFNSLLECRRKVKEEIRDGYQKDISSSKRIAEHTNRKNTTTTSNETNEKFVSKEQKLCGRKYKPPCESSIKAKNMSGNKLPSVKQFANKELNAYCSKSYKNRVRKEYPKRFRVSLSDDNKPIDQTSMHNMNEPILLSYTENFEGKSRELLMCTNDIIEDVFKSKSTMQCDEALKSLLARSKAYSGKPIHIIFEPRTAVLSPPVSSVTRNYVPLHPSPAKHNLLSAEHEVREEKGRKSRCFKTSRPNMKSSNVKRATENPNQKSNKTENRSSAIDRFDSRARQNNKLQVSSFQTRKHPSESIGKRKLIVRFCRRKKYRTVLKRVNVKKITTSVFRDFFHFYSLLGGNLKSGSVITKSNSIHWLREAGVTTDAHSQKTAKEVFTAVAGTKVVLNIFDYLQFLIAFARRQRIAAADLVKQLTICKRPMLSKETGRRRQKTTQHLKQNEQRRAQMFSSWRSQSLPNLKKHTF